MKTPFCTAPFTAVLVDPDKGVRPCCDFEGHLGNLRDEPLAEVLASPGWTAVRDQVSRGDLPDGCVGCYNREKATGWSVRRNFLEAAATRSGAWSKGLTEIEINSSNVCNLTCTHCGPKFSTGWLPLAAKLQDAGAPHHRGLEDQILRGDPERMVAQLGQLDLSHLEVVRFKGGEPMLNPEVPAVLRTLRDRGILPRLQVDFVSNGTTVNEEVLELLRAARSVIMCISVDGAGKVQEYIRRGPSAITRIERFLEVYAALPAIEYRLSVSVMAYNVFSLDRIAAWWNGLRRRFPGQARYRLCFPLEVIQPAMLSIRVLQDHTRRRLLGKYRGLFDADYSHVIKSLKQPFAGEALHNDFVAYTRAMDRIWKTEVLDAIPELEPEMVLLEAPGPSPKKEWVPASWRRLLARRPPDSKAETLRKGVSLSRSGRFRRAVRLYDRYLARDAATTAASWEIQLHRAVLLAKMERWQHSLAEFDALVRRDPRSVLQQLEEARQSGDEANGGLLRAIPDNVRQELAVIQTPLFRLFVEGLAHRALDEGPEAAAALDKALALDPGFMLASAARREISAGPLHLA